jgi:hypothetical protein
MSSLELLEESGGFFATKKNYPHWYEDEPDLHPHRSKICKYNQNLVPRIQSVYLLASIGWVLIILLLKLYEVKIIGWIFLILPLFIYFINYINASNCTSETEDEMFQGNFLSFGFLIAIIILNWNTPALSDKSKFFKILVLAFILLMLSLVDLWVSKVHLTIVKHIKSALQTSSLFLLALSLYIYYVDQTSISF